MGLLFRLRLDEPGHLVDCADAVVNHAVGGALDIGWDVYAAAAVEDNADASFRSVVVEGNDAALLDLSAVNWDIAVFVVDALQ